MLSDNISLQVSKEIIDMFNTKNKLIIGCRCSGKTEILKNAILLNFYTNKIKNIVVFSVNENMSYLMKRDISNMLGDFDNVEITKNSIKINEGTVFFLSSIFWNRISNHGVDEVYCDEFSLFEPKIQEEILNYFNDKNIKITTGFYRTNKYGTNILSKLLCSERFKQTYLEWFNLKHLNDGLYWVKKEPNTGLTEKIIMPENIDEKEVIKLNNKLLNLGWTPSSERIEKLEKNFNYESFCEEVLTIPSRNFIC